MISIYSLRAYLCLHRLGSHQASLRNPIRKLESQGETEGQEKKVTWKVKAQQGW